VRFDDTVQGWPTASGEGGHWNVESSDTYSHASSAPVVDVNGAEADAIRLRAEVEALRGTLREARRAHHHDLAVIGEALAETAERHEWCSEYDDHVANLTPRLSVDGRDVFATAAEVNRVRAFTVTVSVTATVDVTVEARNADEARESFYEDPHAYLPYAGGYDIDETEISEVSEE
jgi:hypothetical protein